MTRTCREEWVSNVLDDVAEIAAEAGRIAAGRCGTGYRRWEKVPGHPVCDVDLEVDAYLRAQLHKVDPEAGWLSEETLDVSDRYERRRLWVVDPIDGTRDYLRERTGWCVSVALVAVSTASARRTASTPSTVSTNAPAGSSTRSTSG